ncbi:MAG: NAD-dependent epimerase/dehydratase family protein [Erythrobacter sp.]|nr:NAD-dependent epimerase/dehydratase family protein [Erythrobacter sp.]
MKALVIGGTRFIGAHVVRALSEAGAEVTVFHRGKTANPLLPNVTHFTDPLAEYPITKFPASLRTDWDVVVHMVAMGEADGKAAAAHFAGRAGRLVMISSADVYLAYGRLTKREPGPVEPTPLTEESALRAIMFPYQGYEEKLGAWARNYEKILAEQAIRAVADLDWTILRLPKVYGPEDNSDLSTVYGFAANPSWRWTHGHVVNVAAAIALAAQHPDARRSIFNVGEANTPTVGERLSWLPKRETSQAMPPPFEYQQRYAVDTSKIRKELGYADIVDEKLSMIQLASSVTD